MGRRGPLPKKNFQRVLSGKLPLRKENLSDGKYYYFDPPDPPDHLSEDEKKIWDRTIQLIKPLKHLSKVDTAVLAAYCCSYVRWSDSEEEIQRMSRTSRLKGLLAPGAGGGVVINPLVNISRRSQADMVTYAAQLGMTPASRLRDKIQGAAPTKNPFEKLKDENKE